MLLRQSVAKVMIAFGVLYALMIILYEYRTLNEQKNHGIIEKKLNFATAVSLDKGIHLSDSPDQSDDEDFEESIDGMLPKTDEIPNVVVPDTEKVANVSNVNNTAIFDSIWDCYERIQITLICRFVDGVAVIDTSKSLIFDVKPTTLYAMINVSILQGDCFNKDICLSSWNFSTGLGENHIAYWLNASDWVNQNATGELSAIKTLSANLNRTRVPIVIRRTLPNSNLTGVPLQTCTLEQSCSHWIDASRPCGIKKLEEMKPMFMNQTMANAWSVAGGWSGFEKFANEACSPDGIAMIKYPAIPRWYVPCTDCGPNAQCNWKDAKWFSFENTESCVYDQKKIESDHVHLLQYLKFKQLIAVGDSTIRALLVALIEHLNGTLGAPYDTHFNFTINLNDKQISAHFSYYPVFNLPLEQQPTFMDKIKVAMSLLDPNLETILLIGGAQWLMPDHLTELHQFLGNSQKLNTGFKKVRVIIKDHSAGFHSPITGLYSLTLPQRLAENVNNQALILQSKEYGWPVIRTHNLTWSRFNHFEAYARCSCHFHQLVAGTQPNTYHVAGPIHYVMLRLFENALLTS